MRRSAGAGPESGADASRSGPKACRARPTSARSVWPTDACRTSTSRRSPTCAPHGPRHRHRRHRRARRRLRASGDGQRGGRRGDAAAAPRAWPTFVLKYRLAEYGFPAPLQDVLRAVRIVRSRAAEFGVRPDRIGVMGASAGGHLAAMAGTLFDAPEGRTGAALDAVSARPDFLALLYPGDHDGAARTHIATRRATCWGPSPSAALDRPHVGRSPGARHDAADLPRAHRRRQQRAARTQPRLPAALRRAGVPAELHLYEQGAHGFGVAARPGSDLRSGPTAGCRWMRARGFLPSTPATTAAAAADRAAVGARHRRPAQGRPRQRHVPQSDPRRRPPRSVDPEGRRRLLHDVLVVRCLSGAGRSGTRATW